MPFTKVVAAGIGSTGTVTLENLIVTGIFTGSSSSVSSFGSISVGIGGTAITTTGIGSVGIGTTNPTATLTVSGTLDGSAFESYELDDISALTDGATTTFPLTFNTQTVSITNPLNLLVTVNGILQSAFINNPDDFPVLAAYDGYTIDADGKIKFSEALPAGTNVMIRVIPGSLTRTKVKYYPFKPTNIVLG